jgi:hypothetical protein
MDAMIARPSIVMVLNENACLCVNVLISEHEYLFDHATETAEELESHESGKKTSSSCCNRV